MNTGHLISCLLGWLFGSRTKSDKECGCSDQGSRISLKKLASEYEAHLCDKDFVFEKKGSKKPVVLRFKQSNFAHLVSLSSFAKRNNLDPEPFSGYEGWKNVEKGVITFDSLKKLDPEEYDYYRREWDLFAHLCSDFFREAGSVRFLPDQVPGKTSLNADYILYAIHGNEVIHLGISKDENGSYFPRSYFVRALAKDKAYPTKYIAGMPDGNLIFKGVK